MGLRGQSDIVFTVPPGLLDRLGIVPFADYAATQRYVAASDVFSLGAELITGCLQSGEHQHNESCLYENCKADPRITAPGEDEIEMLKALAARCLGKIKGGRLNIGGGKFVTT